MIKTLFVLMLSTFSAISYASLSDEIAKAEMGLTDEADSANGKSKSLLKYGYVCMTETIVKSEDKSQRLVCLKSKSAPESSVCFCKDNLNKTKKNVAGKIVVGSRVSKKVAALKGMASAGGICYQMPKWMGSKGETAWYCSDDAFTGHDTKEMCEARCVGI